MSNVKKSLDDLTADIRARQTHIDTLQQTAWKEISALQRTQGDLLRAYIREARLLDLCTWNLIVSGSNVSLSAEEYSNEPKVKELSSYVETDYHCSFGLAVEPYRNDRECMKDVVTLRFDDGEIRIIFDEPNCVSKFIKEFGLKVDTSRVDEKMENLQDTLCMLQSLKNQVLV